MPKCKDCQRSIIWAKTERDKNMPLDALPHEDGNAILHADGTCSIVTPAKRGDTPIAMRHKTHWETCPARAKKQQPESKPAASKPETSSQLRLAPPIAHPPQLPPPSQIRPLIATKDILGRNESAALNLARLQLDLTSGATAQASELLVRMRDATPEDREQALLRVLLMLQNLDRGIDDIRTIINIARDCSASAVALPVDGPDKSDN